MSDNWQLIYSSSLQYKVELVKAVLQDSGIESVLVNKKDSSYHFGEIELFVQLDDVLRSKQIINREKL